MQIQMGNRYGIIDTVIVIIVLAKNGMSKGWYLS